MDRVPINDHEVNKLIAADVWRLHHDGSNQWRPKAAGRMLGEWRPIPNHWLGKRYNARYPTRTAAGVKVKVGENYPLGKDGTEGTGYLWTPAEGDTEFGPFRSFAEASAAAVEQGASGSWVRAKGRHMGSTWFDAATVGKVPGVKWAKPGVPCCASILGDGRGGGGSTCMRLIDRDGRCKLHANAYEKRQAADAEMAARFDARREADRREAEARKAAEEILAEISPLLVAAGLRPETFDVTRSGDIAGPAESVRELVRLAAELTALPEDLLAEIVEISTHQTGETP